MDPQANNEQDRPVNSNSITGLVLGILSLVLPYVGLILGIIGIVLSKKALREIKEHNHNGRGMAIAGLTTSIIGCALYTIVIVILIIVAIVASLEGV